MEAASLGVTFELSITASMPLSRQALTWSSIRAIWMQAGGASVRVGLALFWVLGAVNAFCGLHGLRVRYSVEKMNDQGSITSGETTTVIPGSTVAGSW
jgi:hypothetical protein